MKNIKLQMIIVLSVLFSYQVFACSMFRIKAGEKVFVTNNEDWKNPNTYMWTEIGEDSFYSVLYFGFDDFFPQGGMNEMGLVFDGFATRFKEIKNQKGKLEAPEHFFKEVMKQCANCDEAYEYMSKYDVSFMSVSQLMFSDAKGKSFIIEGDDFIWGKEDYQIATNFYQSEISDESEITCSRYKTMDKMLKDIEDVTIENCRKIMAMVHQEGDYPTQYSNIYDPVNKVIYLYFFHNYTDELVVDLETELAKGNVKSKLADLFEQPYSYRAFVYNSKLTFGKMIAMYLEDHSVESTEEKLQEILAEPILQYPFVADEDEMNNLGYRYISEGKMDEAIMVFKTNVRLFPDSWNCYDSLGEAYAEAGLYPKAIDNYKRSIELNPSNENGKIILNKLLENYE